MDMIATELAAPANKICHLLKNVVTSTSEMGANCLQRTLANGECETPIQRHSKEVFEFSRLLLTDMVIL